MAAQQPLPAADSPRRGILWVLLALLIVGAVHAASLGGAFVYDDLLLVARNPNLRGWAGLARTFGSSHWDFLAATGAEQVGYWRPLTNLALMLGNALGGGRPWGFHAMSLALHLLCVASVFRLGRRLGGCVQVGFWAALLFGLHPVQVEPVAWISSVNDPLYGWFALLCMHAFLAWRERGSPGRPWSAGAWFLLALLSKENAAAVLPLVLALDLGRMWVARGERERAPIHWLRAYTPLLAAPAAWLLLRALVFGDPTAGLGRVTTDLAVSAWRQVTLRIELFGGFLGLLAWPAQLNLFREARPVIPWSDAALLRAALWILLWVGAVVLAARKRQRAVLTALLILAAGVSPALLRLELLGRFLLSERYLYVSVLGIALLAPLLARRWLPPVPSALLLACIAAAAGWRTHTRIPVWRDELSLFRASAAASPRSVYVHWGLGRVLLDAYRASGDALLLSEALDAFSKAQDLASPRGGAPPDADIFFTLDDLLQANLGVGWSYLMCAVDQRGDCSVAEAELVFREVVKRFPGSELARAGLGVALMHMDRLGEAQIELTRAVELAPGHYESWFNLGQLELRLQRWEPAAAAFERALAIEPKAADAWMLLATARVEGFSGGDPGPVREVLSAARAAAPGHPQPLVQQGALEAKLGRMPQALALFEEALRMDGTQGQVHLLRAKVLAGTGDVQRALGALHEAARLMPDDFETHYLAGMLMDRAGAREQARPYLQRALDIDPQGPYSRELRELLAQ